MYLTPTQLNILLILATSGVLLSLGCAAWMVRRPQEARRALRNEGSRRVARRSSVSVDPTPGPAWRQTMGPESPHPLAWPTVRPF